MSEKEKMLKGELYNANLDKALIDERTKAKEKCYEYNMLRPSDINGRQNIIKQIVHNIGKNFWIEPTFFCDYGYNISIGDNFYSNHNLVILDAAPVKIGNNVFFGPNCGIYTSGHPLEFQIRNDGLEYAKKIEIGDNVWIGGNVVILPNVKIGDNCVIGAGSVVNKDIAPNSIAVGNPCKVIRKIGGNI